MSEFVQSLTSVEFATWIGVFVPLFVASVLVLRALSLPTMAVFVAGIVFSEVSNRAVGWFSERYVRRRGGKA